MYNKAYASYVSFINILFYFFECSGISAETAAFSLLAFFDRYPRRELDNKSSMNSRVCFLFFPNKLSIGIHEGI